MEYSGALSTIVFDESCRLRDLTEAQVGRNQFGMDIVVDRLDREVDHASKRISALEGCQGHSTPTLPVYYSAPSQGQLVQLAVLTR